MNSTASKCAQIISKTCSWAKKQTCIAQGFWCAKCANVLPDLLQKRGAPRVLKYKQKEQLLTFDAVIVNPFKKHDYLIVNIQRKYSRL